MQAQWPWIRVACRASCKCMPACSHQGIGDCIRAVLTGGGMKALMFALTHLGQATVDTVGLRGYARNSRLTVGAAVTVVVQSPVTVEMETEMVHSVVWRLATVTVSTPAPETQEEGRPTRRCRWRSPS